MQTKLADEVFKSFFEMEENITSIEMLSRAAGRAGMDEVAVKDWLQSDQGRNEVEQEVRGVMQAGIRSVPNITLQKNYRVGSGIDPEGFVELFENIREAEEV